MRAVLFDMDGTLVDSEGQTDDAIAAVMERHGHSGAALPPDQTRGRTWGDIVRALHARHAPLDVDDDTLERELVDAWGATVDGMTPLPGAVDCVRLTSSLVRTAVVSSSPRALIERILGKLDLAAVVDAVVGAEDVAHPKPAPDCFLEAATRLQVEPRACVVVEDSRAGLMAARAAGMAPFLVLHCCAEPELCRPLADLAFRDFASLPMGFWRGLAERS